MSKTELLKSLSKVKSEIGKISKDSTNPFFKSKYFDINGLLEHVEPLIQKNGLLLLQPVESGKVRTEIFHIETSEMVFSEMDLPNIQEPQKMGSAITYYRRYTLQSLLGLQAEDDDGNKASHNTSSSNSSKSTNTNIELKWLNKIAKDKKDFTKEWLNIVEAINSKKIKKVSDVRKHYKVSEKIETELNNVINLTPA